MPSSIGPHLPVSVVSVDGVLPQCFLGLLALEEAAARAAADSARPRGLTLRLFENEPQACSPGFAIHSLW